MCPVSVLSGLILMTIYDLLVETNETVRYIRVSVEGGFTWIQINHIFAAHSNMAVNGAMSRYFFYIFKALKKFRRSLVSIIMVRFYFVVA